MHVTLRCVECGARWDAAHDRRDHAWQVFFTAAQPPVPIAYCPGCSSTRSTTRHGRRSAAASVRTK